MGIIRDFLEEFFKEVTGTKIPTEILDTTIEKLKYDASNLMAWELSEGFEGLRKAKPVRKLRKLLPWNKGPSVKSLKNIMSPAQKAAKLKHLKSSQKAINRLKNLRKGAKGASKLKGTSEAAKQLQKTARATAKVAKVGKNLGKSKGFLRGMGQLCKKHPIICGLAALGVAGGVYHEEIRDWADDFWNGGIEGAMDTGADDSYVQYGTAEWRKRKGLPPLPPN